ncbi:S26 family signal peptidase [Salinispora vitiensis]|uniref:S26 family signal peptidase n=1 Tax=Salinispora vitiensis TaxID=999544 RepID=UPI0009B7704B
MFWIGAPVAIALLYFLHRWIGRTFVLITVKGESMKPALLPGDRVLVRRGARGIRRGCIVVVARPNPVTGWRGAPPVSPDVGASDWYIKRLAAMAGDLMPPPMSGRSVVPANHVVVFGDNLPSADSRQFGACPIDQVLGVVVHEF